MEVDWLRARQVDRRVVGPDAIQCESGSAVVGGHFCVIQGTDDFAAGISQMRCGVFEIGLVFAHPIISIFDRIWGDSLHIFHHVDLFTGGDGSDQCCYELGAAPKSADVTRGSGVRG